MTPGTSELDELAALRTIVEGTATETGERFFTALVENLVRAMGTMGAWIAVLEEHEGQLRAVSMKMRDQWFGGFTYRLEGTPCRTAMEERRSVHIPDRVIELYADVPALVKFGAVSYLGVPLFDTDGRIMGQLAVLDDKPMPEEPRGTAIFRIFASRAAAELRRLAAERAIRDREAQLTRLLDGAMDAIVNLDDAFRIVLMNPAATRAFGYAQGAPIGEDFKKLLTSDSRRRLEDCAEQLIAREQERTSLWIAGGLHAVTSHARDFQAEATLSRYREDSRFWFTLILRDVEDRLAAERQIRSLIHETEYLREELRPFQTFEPIIGSSRTLLRTLHQLEQVAPTDATVLLLGETGTGKELFARALHTASRRSHKPFIRVNCGAIPANLMESELFGHEKGAFTGATNRRAGRFALADGGTIFLDELGELPLDLQPKLLRVLQEGEFESVGSSRTVKVDVRVVAATNRNIAERVEQGAFREDLYYRLNVFPITVPSLRDRAEDIGVLAQAFIDRFSRRMGRALEPLTEAAIRRLCSYSWPGNVRELQNVMERGVIVSTGSHFDIDLALPAPPLPDSPAPATSTASAEQPILSIPELAELERTNILRALDATDWKVAGTQGAAALLRINASTLSSRMRALRLKRPKR